MPRSGTGVASQPPSTSAVVGTTIESAKFNSVISDIYAIFNQQWPLSLSQTILSLGGQPLNTNLTSLSTLGTAADKIAYTTGAGVWAETAFPAWARAFNGAADIAAAKVALSAQPLDAALTSIAGLTYVQGDTLYATAADTLVVLPKGTAGQVLTMNGGATAPSWATPLLSKTYQSATTGISVSTWQNFAHGFGTKPTILKVSLVCANPDIGYSVGQELLVATMDSPGFAGLNVECDATNVSVFISGGLRVFDKATGAFSAMTLGNWRWQITAYA